MPAPAASRTVSRKGNRAIGRLLAIVATALVLLWPAYINGGPFWFPDTSAYIRSADAAIVTLGGAPSEWSDRLRVGEDGPAASQAEPEDVAAMAGELRPSRPVISGRSIYYGFLLALPMRFAGAWGAIAVQAVLVAAILVVCFGIGVRAGLVRSPLLFGAGFAAIMIFSPLPFYTSMLMPDVYAGLIILCLSLAIVAWSSLTMLERTGLVLASGAMASFHSTNLLLAASLGIGGALLLLPRKAAWHPLMIAGPVIAIAVAASTVFNFAVANVLDARPIPPPFLSARLVADGPGTDYLQSECPSDEGAWALCRHRDRLPVQSDSLLWSKEPEDGVFQLSSDQDQRRMAREDKRFAMAVLAHDPLGVIRISFASVARQFAGFDLENFNFSDERLKGVSAKYPPNILAEIAVTKAMNRSMPTHFTVVSTVILTCASVVLLAWITLRSMTGTRKLPADVVRLAVLLILGVVANGVICGGLSGAKSRYQMRLIWLVPLVVCVVGSRGLSAAPSASGRTDLAERPAS